MAQPSSETHVETWAEMPDSHFVTTITSANGNQEQGRGITAEQSQSIASDKVAVARSEGRWQSPKYVKKFLDRLIG